MSQPPLQRGDDPGVDVTAPEAPPPRSRIAAVRAQLASVNERIEAARETIPAVDAAVTARGHDNRVAGNLLASAIAYRLFLWILPLSLVLAGILGLLRERAERQPSEVAEDLGLSAYIASTVADASEQAEQGRWVLLGIGLFALYFASASAARTLVVVHQLVWGAPRTATRSFRGALGFTGIAFATVLVAVGAHVVTDRAEHRVLAQLIVFAAFGVVSLLAARVLPHGDAPWPRLLPGALLVVVGVFALQCVTAFYLVGKLKSSSELYGGLGAAAAILLWLYFIGRLIVASAVLNAALWQRKQASEHAEAGTG